MITNRNVYTRFRLVPKSITSADLEQINGRFRITRNGDFQPLYAKICRRGSRLVASMSLELFVRGLYTRIAIARHPCFSWAFLFCKSQGDNSLPIDEHHDTH